MGLDLDVGVEREAVQGGAERARVEAGRVGGGLAQALDGAAGVGAEGHATLDRCGGEEGQQGVGVSMGGGVFLAGLGPEAAVTEEADDVHAHGVDRIGHVLEVGGRVAYASWRTRTHPISGCTAAMEK